MSAPDWVVANWPGSATILAVRSQGLRHGRSTDETRYYVTSLRSSARVFLRTVRQRWSIENSWHWVRDKKLDEDDHRYRETNGVQILATLRSLAIHAMRLLVTHRGHRGTGSRHQGPADAVGMAGAVPETPTGDF